MVGSCPDFVDFDELEQIPLCLARDLPSELLTEFDLERREETLHHCVVVTLPAPNHAHRFPMRSNARAMAQVAN